MTTPRHAPVLLDRVVALLAPALEAPGSVYVDCTLGLGGHSEAVLERLPNARVIGIDRDPTALQMSSERLAAHGDRFTAVHAVYDELPEVVGSLGPRPRRRRLLRPRRLLDAARRPRARLRLRRGRTARHADGPDDRPDRGRAAQHRHRPGADPHPAGVRRGEVRQQDRPRGGPPARDDAVHHQRRPRRAALRDRSPPRRGVRVDTPPSAPSRRCGWRSTTSSPSCAGRSPPPSR